MKRKRRRRSAAARIRPFWMLLCACAIVIAGALTFAATYPGFDVTRVALSGNRHVSRNEIVARAAIAPHTSIWLQNTAAIARRIEAIPYIGTAGVGRVPPSTLRIRVAERVPFAILRSGDDVAIVDRSLRVLESPSGPTLLPTIAVEPGIDLTPGAFVQSRRVMELRDAYDAVVAARINPIELQYDRFGGLVVTLPGGLRLLLGGRADLSQKLTLANAILSQVVTRKERIAAIDLRAPSAPILVYR